MDISCLIDAGNSKLERLLASGNSELQALLEQSRRRVDTKISYGEKSAKRNRYRDLLDVKLRVYKVVGHDDDLFLRTRDMGSKQVGVARVVSFVICYTMLTKQYSCCTCKIGLSWF